MLNKLDNGNKEFLDITVLRPGLQFTGKIGYIQNFSSGLSRTEQNFFTFYIKDVNGKPITGRMFSIENIVTSGFNASALVGKVVKLDFLAQVWAGSLCLVVTHIEAYNEPISVKKFIGVIDNAEKCYTVLDTLLAKRGILNQLPKSIVDETYNGIYSGKVGGYAKFCYNVVKDITEICISNEELNATALVQATVETLVAYRLYRQRMNVLEYITISEKLEILNSVKARCPEEIREVVSDCITGLMEMSRPEHLYANLIQMAINKILEVTELISVWDTIPGGVTKEINGKVLTRY